MNDFSLRGRKIDCHTHIINPAVRDAYFARTSGYALVMQFPENIMKNPECIETVTRDDRLFLNPCIDLSKNITSQLELIEKNIEEWKVVGLKIYLSYQRGKASDKELYPVYEFASENSLSVTFHTGLCSLVLPSDNDVDGSSAIYAEIAAKDFPDVNFIIAHMDDPRFDSCIDIISRYDNMFTDFCGAYETGTKEGSDIESAITAFGKAIHSRTGTEKKILYGTDFCPPINLSQIDEYDYSIEKIFDEKDFPLIYFKNCIRAYPRLGKYIDEKDLDIV